MRDFSTRLNLILANLSIFQASDACWVFGFLFFFKLVCRSNSHQFLL